MAKAEDVKDVLDGRREFIFEDEGSEEIHYFIANPTGEDIRKADWQYSKVYNQAIVDEFLTQSQMLELLRQKGIVSDDYERLVDAVRIGLAAELFKLESIPDDEESEGQKEAIAQEVARLRDELFQLNQRVQGPMGNTCENLAEDARIEFLTSRLIENKDRSKVWDTFVDYRNEENTTLAVKARFEVMLWMQGLDSNFLENTPERKALAEVAQLRMDRAVRSIEDENKEKNKETEEVEEISLDTAESVPKKTRKKTARKASPRKTVTRKANTKSEGVPKKKRGRPKKEDKRDE